MHSVIDTKSTLLVIRKGNDFVIQYIATGETVVMNSSKFLGGSFKYESEILRKFQSAFKDREKNINNIILSYEASDFMNDIITFNRIDN